MNTKNHYFLGIDISTSHSKVLILDSNGLICATSLVPHQTIRSKSLYSEQNPDEWWETCSKAIKQAISKTNLNVHNIDCVGITGQMCTLVLLDKRGDVVRPAILWNDRRSLNECDQMLNILSSSDWLRITGNLPSPGLTAPKIVWLMNHESASIKKSRSLLLPKDYIRYRLTGCMATDYSDASSTLLFDIQNLDWSNEICRALKVPPYWLPQCHDGLDIISSVSKEASIITGIKEGTPVIIGGADQSTQAIGSGVIDPGEGILTIGTSGNLLLLTNKPFVDPKARVRSYSHCIKDIWLTMGITISAGDSLRWYKECFGLTKNKQRLDDKSYQLLLKDAANSPIGCKGLIFLPYLNGVRTPYLDPLARGGFIGLTLDHLKSDCTRAVLEGVAFSIRDSKEIMTQSGLKLSNNMKFSGGGARSELWRQIFANILDVKLITPSIEEGASLGVTLMSSVAFGNWNSLRTACHAVVRYKNETHPQKKYVKKYDQLYQSYSMLYEALKNTFWHLAEYGE
jgi:xylulokinase